MTENGYPGEDATSQASPAPANARCARFETSLNQWIDLSVESETTAEGVPADGELLQRRAELTGDPHLRDCGRCRRTLELWTQIDPLLAHPTRFANEVRRLPGSARSLEGQSGGCAHERVAVDLVADRSDGRSRRRIEVPTRSAVRMLAAAACVWLAVDWLRTDDQRTPSLSPSPMAAVSQADVSPRPSAPPGRELAAVERAAVKTDASESDRALSLGSYAAPVPAPVLALASSQRWARHVANPEDWRAAGWWMMPPSVSSSRSQDWWGQYTGPTIGQLQYGMEPLGNALRAAARVMTGRGGSELSPSGGDPVESARLLFPTEADAARASGRCPDRPRKPLSIGTVV